MHAKWWVRLSWGFALCGLALAAVWLGSSRLIALAAPRLGLSLSETITVYVVYGGAVFWWSVFAGTAGLGCAVVAMLVGRRRPARSSIVVLLANLVLVGGMLSVLGS